MKILRSIAACGALLVSSPVVAADDVYANAGGWEISRNNGNCLMITTFERQTVVMIDYNLILNDVYFYIMDPVLKSVESDKKYTLSLIFSSQDKYDDGWGTLTATGIVGETIRGLRFKLEGRDFLNDFARYETVTIKRGEVLVESLILAGSAEAIAKLRACAKSEAIANPVDPLEGM